MTVYIWATVLTESNQKNLLLWENPFQFIMQIIEIQENISIQNTLFRAELLYHHLESIISFITQKLSIEYILAGKLFKGGLQISDFANKSNIIEKYISEK